jgi:hypothetical protein
MTQPVYAMNPQSDPRWGRLVSEDPRASVFHSVGWLRALQETYGFEPIAFTTSAPGEKLQNVAVFCKVDSWVTGHRLVSLPFSDHCDFLGDDGARSALPGWLEEWAKTSGLKYIETRETRALTTVAEEHQDDDQRFFLHRIDLTPDLTTIFQNFHRNSIQRKIERAARERLIYRESTDDSLLGAFYGLLVGTRRRHLAPPQPIRWFRHLLEHCAGAVKIRVAFSKDHAIAALLTIRHKDTLVYKYGCSDQRSHPLGAMPFLFWEAIQDAKNSGLKELDLGRSERSNSGLVTFKDRLGGSRSGLTYSRLGQLEGPVRGWETRSPEQEKWAAGIFRTLPDWALRSVGSVVYKHIG